MPSSRVEGRGEREEREQRAAAERVVDAMVDALALAGLPPLPGLSAGRVTVTPDGVHVEIGGCTVRALRALAEHVTAHAGCTGRVLRGETVPSGLAELPGLPHRVRYRDEPTAPPQEHHDPARLPPHPDRR
ncbi:hypothetical protein GCM10009665_62020 [Kitasatospora nipponensis]|uniref:YbaB/EbfC DNA-binding family protein n=1 Tax=Kitasatospora nipponensis TaxID=258049 RepID=A0ABP4HJ75_9ACTN